MSWIGPQQNRGYTPTIRGPAARSTGPLRPRSQDGERPRTQGTQHANGHGAGGPHHRAASPAATPSKRERGGHGQREADQAGETQRKPEAHAPEEAAGTHDPGEDEGKKAGKQATEHPQGKTPPGRPATTAARIEPQEPGEAAHPPRTKATRPDPGPATAAKATRARERARRRERRGTEGPPPAHQKTRPAAKARATEATAEPDQEPRPPRPKAAKTEGRQAKANAAPKTNASAPTQHPTATARPAETTDETTRATSADAEEGRERDPAKATTATGHPQRNQEPRQHPTPHTA